MMSFQLTLSKRAAYYFLVSLKHDEVRTKEFRNSDVPMLYDAPSPTLANVAQRNELRNAMVRQMS